VAEPELSVRQPATESAKSTNESGSALAGDAGRRDIQQSWRIESLCSWRLTNACGAIGQVFRGRLTVEAALATLGVRGPGRHRY
jgi:hypothetical protein